MGQERSDAIREAMLLPYEAERTADQTGGIYSSECPYHHFEKSCYSS